MHLFGMISQKTIFIVDKSSLYTKTNKMGASVGDNTQNIICHRKIENGLLMKMTKTAACFCFSVQFRCDCVLFFSSYSCVEHFPFLDCLIDILRINESQNEKQKPRNETRY